MTAGERPLQRVARPFAFHDHGVPLIAIEVSQHGVGELAVDFDTAFPSDRVAVMAGGSRIAEELDEETGEEIAEDFLLAEGVEPAGGDQVGPVLELGGIDGGE